MAFVPVPNTVQVEVVYELDGQVVENVLYYEKAGPVTGEEITGLLDSVRIAITDNLLPLLSSAISLVRLIGTLLDAIDAISIVTAVSPPVSGGDAGESVPSNAAYAIQFKTALRGRSFRGRNFIAGLPNGSVSINTVDSTVRSDLVGFYALIGAAGADDGWTHVVVSRISGGAPRVTGVTTPVITYDTADAILDSQRRRLPGRGI